MARFLASSLKRLTKLLWENVNEAALGFLVRLSKNLWRAVYLSENRPSGDGFQVKKLF